MHVFDAVFSGSGFDGVELSCTFEAEAIVGGYMMVFMTVTR